MGAKRESVVRVRLSDLNLMIGMGWASPDDALLMMTFSHNDVDGHYANVQCGEWSACLSLGQSPDEPYASFRLGDVRGLVRHLRPFYANQHAMLTFKTLPQCWCVEGGPGNGRVLFKNENEDY